MQQKPVIIFGTADLGQSVDFYLTHDSTYTVAAYCSSRAALEKSGFSILNDKPVVAFEDIEKTYPPETFQMFVAVGYGRMNAMREEFIVAAEAKGYHLLSHICSSVSSWPGLVMGANVFVFDHNNIQPNVTLGKGVILGRGSNIGHDSVIEDYAFLANHVVLCGHNHIGRGCFIGSNSTIMDGVTLAEKTLIGAAAYIKRNTTPSSVYITPETPVSQKKSDEFFNW